MRRSKTGISAQRLRQVVGHSACAFVECLEQRWLLSVTPHRIPKLKDVGFNTPLLFRHSPVQPAPIQRAPARHAPPHHTVSVQSSKLIPTYTGFTTPYGGITPAQMRGAYGVPGISFNSIAGDGSSETIAILDPGDDPALVNSTSPAFSSSDLAIFDNYYGLPNPPSFTKMGFTDPSDGSTPALTTTLPVANTAASQYDLELTLDVEWSHVIAPNANILLVEGAPDFSDILNGILAINAAAPSMNIIALSMSFGGPEDENLSSTAQAEAFDGSYFDTSGLVYLASTGDYGAYADGPSTIGPNFPATSSNVLAVGGTTLSVSGTNWAGETTWGNGTSSGTQTGGGGGFSVYEPQPSYQVGKVNGLSSTARTLPDISLEANDNPGVPVYDSTDFGTGTGWIPGTVGGTSLSTPMMAGLVAIADQGRALNGLAALNSSGDSGVAASNPNGNPASLDIHAILYGLGYANSDFNDITTGASIGPSSYGPMTGYDLSTGLGSPQANNLVPDLAALAPAITTQPISQTITVGSNVTFTAAATGTPTPTVQWQYSTNGGISYLPIAGATSTTYTAAATASESGYMYEAVFTNDQGPATTNPATLIVDPTWLSTTSVATWNWTTHVLTVTGPTTITDDPGADEPIVEASGDSAVISLNSLSTDIHLGGLSLTGGASATVTSLGAARTLTNYRLLVIGVAGATVAPMYTIDSSSTLDLADNDMAILYGSGTSPLAAIASELSGAYDNDLWDKPGLTSSVAAGNVHYGLGYGEASTLGYSSFDGLTLGGNAVLVKYTLIGDLNLDGTVDANDIALLAPNYGQAATSWTQGDVNYDGIVNQDDLSLITPNYGESAYPSA